MRANIAIAAAGAALLAAACGGNNSCPTTSGNADTQVNPACGGTPQQVQVTLQMCEACSHTAPTCVPQVDLAGQHIFLETRWDICTDQSSCAARSCQSATCQFAVPSGTYRMETLTGPSTSIFHLTVDTGTPTCTAWGV